MIIWSNKYYKFKKSPYNSNTNYIEPTCKNKQYTYKKVGLVVKVITMSVLVIGSYVSIVEKKVYAPVLESGLYAPALESDKIMP